MSPSRYHRAVIKLRLVEEYRGRRIVSNGKLYGIQGELITDCRYMTTEGARNAVDSEAGMAERRRYLEWHRGKLAECVARDGAELDCDCG